MFRVSSTRAVLKFMFYSFGSLALGCFPRRSLLLPPGKGYSASAYLSSKILAEMPSDAVFPVIFGTT